MARERKKPLDVPYPRVHVYVDADDLEWFKDYFGKTMGLSKAIRAVMKSYRKKIEATQALRDRAAGLGQTMIIPDDIEEELLRIAQEDRLDE